MNEQLISLETAKLAKEKGFEIETSHYYFEDGEFREHKLTGTNGYYGEDYCFELEEFLENWNSKWVTKKNGDRCFGCNKSNGYFETYSAPTQSLLQKWLREVHKIDICINPHYFVNGGIAGYLVDIYLQNESGCKYSSSENTYEASLEAGLLNALQLIK